MTFEPYDWQRADLALLRANNYTGLLNIQPGGGKTPLSIWALDEAQSQVNLVIAPLNTHEKTWIKTVKTLTGKDVRKIGNGKKSEREAMFDFEMNFPGWYLITPQLFTRLDISGWSMDGVIVDEIHMLNKPRSAGGKQLERLAHLAEHRLGLSGTPSRRSFERNWTNMRFLHPELMYRGQVAHDNFFMWTKTRMVGEEIYTSQRNRDGSPKKVMQWQAEAEPGRLFNEAPCVVQHFRRDKCCDFHPEGFLSLDEPQVIERVVQLNPKQKRAIKELEDQYLAWLDNQPLVVELTITQRQRIRQMCLGVPTLSYTLDEDGEEVTNVDFEADCESPFADEVEAILENLDDNEPVIIHLESQRFARALTERLTRNGYKAAEYSGKTSKVRDSYLERFGTDIQVLVAVSSAFGTGTDGAQRVCKTEIILEHPVDDVVAEQRDARLDRMGRRDQIQRYVIHDSEGYSAGQLSAQLTKRLLSNISNRKAV